MSMAKRTTDKISEPPKPKYSDGDIAEFVTALESDDQREVVTDIDGLAIADKRKIIAEQAPALKRKRGRAGSDETDVNSVLKPQPAEEMQRLTRSKRNFPWGWVIGIIALLAVVSVAGFFVFNRAKKFSNTNVQVSFRPMVAAVSGSAYTVTVEYQNNEPVDLLDVELAVSYPEGFTYLSSEPAAAKEFSNAFMLGTLRSGQAGKVTMVGTIIGAVGEARDFSATMTYRPSNFNSEFQQKTTSQTTISASILSVAFTGPTQLSPGASGTWTVAYENTSDRDLNDVQMSATYPDGFTVTATKPTAQERSAVWSFEKIAKGAKGTIVISGTVDGTIGDTLPLKISAGLLTATNTIDIQDEQSLLVILVKTGVTTTVAVNGSADPVAVDPGAMLNYTVRVTNSSDVELNNVTISITLDGLALDLAKLSNDSKASVKDNVLTWSKDQLAALTSLKPAQAVPVSFAVGTKSAMTVATDADRNPNVTATINVTSPGLVSNTNSASLPATVVLTKVATQLSLTASARYYDDQGIAVGSGTITPTANVASNYRVIWSIVNTTSDATAMVVSARLPNNVLWTGKNLSRDAGDLVFDATTRTVRWTLNTVPAGTGGSLPTLKAYFEVSITPTPEQVGTVPILIETSTATATDSYSNKALTSPAATLTTELLGDPKAAGAGIVVAA